MCVISLPPSSFFLSFFASQCILGGFCRFEAESFGVGFVFSFLLSSCSRAQTRCYCARKSVCTCLLKTMKSSIPAEQLVMGFDQNLCCRT